VANKDSTECDLIGKQIQDRKTNPLDQLGTIRKFNGVNVEQTRYYNHIHCATYIEKIVSHHGWNSLKIRSPPTTMKRDSKYQADIQTSRGPESINSFHAMAVILRPTFGVLFFGGISPSKIRQIAPLLATIQTLSKPRVFLLTAFVLWSSYNGHLLGSFF
jgi:hypothetical protein